MTAATLSPRTLAPVPADEPLSLAVLGRPRLAFAVRGLPVTQGSHAYKGHRNGKPLILDSADRNGELTRWRQQVAAAALAALPYGWEPMDGPCVMDLVVTLRRNSRTPKTKRAVPATKPDLSKLVRAVEDGIGDTAPQIDPKKRVILTEDSRIVAYRRCAKVFERDPFERDALRYPGAVVRLWDYPESLLGALDGVGDADGIDHTFTVYDDHPTMVFAMDEGLWRVDTDTEPGDDDSYASMSTRQLVELEAIAQQAARNARAHIDRRGKDA